MIDETTPEGTREPRLLDWATLRPRLLEAGRHHRGAAAPAELEALPPWTTDYDEGWSLRHALSHPVDRLGLFGTPPVLADLARRGAIIGDGVHGSLREGVYFAVSDAIGTLSRTRHDGRWAACLTPICPYRQGQNVRDQAREKYRIQGLIWHDPQLDRRRISWGTGVAGYRVEDAILQIAASSAKAPIDAAIRITPRWGSEMGRIDYVRGPQRSEIVRADRRDAALFEAVVAWADPIGSYDQLTGEHANIAGNYTPRPTERLVLPPAPAVTATLRSIARMRAADGVRAWLASIGLPPDIADHATYEGDRA